MKSKAKMIAMAKIMTIVTMQQMMAFVTMINLMTGILNLKSNSSQAWCRPWPTVWEEGTGHREVRTISNHIKYIWSDYIKCYLVKDMIMSNVIWSKRWQCKMWNYCNFHIKSQILGREGPTVSTPPTQLSHNPPDHSNMSLLNLKFKRRKVDSRDSDGKNKLST